MIWHSQDAETVLQKLGTDAEYGLAANEISPRIRTYGKNVLTRERKSPAAVFFKYTFGKTSVALIAISVILFLTSVIWSFCDISVPIVLLVFVFLKGTLLGSFEYFGCLGINRLLSTQKSTTTVLRGGAVATVRSEGLVPGDIILLNKGDLVPADCRLITSMHLHCNEKSIGGTQNAEKSADADSISDIAGLDKRINMLYMGCAVTSGNAKAVVTETGDMTELGKLYKQNSGKGIGILSSFTSIQNKLNLTLIIELAVAALTVLCGIVYGIIAGEPFWGNLLNVITLAACCLAAYIPDIGTPLSYIITFLRLKKMKNSKIVINELSTINNLAATTVICCDKTGCITFAEKMNVKQVFDGNELYDIDRLDDSSERVLHLAALCCDGNVSFKNGKEFRSGDSTQTAIISAALVQLNMTAEDLQLKYPRMACIPFDKEHKTMTTVNMINGSPLAIVRGTPDRILPMCNNIDSDAVFGVISAMASNALRVIAVAVKSLDDVPSDPTHREIECDLKFVGLLGLYNPPRVNAHAAVTDCIRHGIKIVMMTGDDKENAKAFAKSLDILPDDGAVTDELAVSSMTDEVLAANIGKYSVFSGLSGESKMRIVNALKAAGHTVLMTGDAIEDIEALRAADVGCTPMAKGTDIAKQSSQLMTDGGIFTIASSVFRARYLLKNIEYAAYFSCGFGISMFVLALLSVFTGAFSFAEILVTGIIAMMLFPLYFGHTEPVTAKFASVTLKEFLPAALAALVFSVFTGFFSGSFAAASLCALLISYALLAFKADLGKPIYDNGFNMLSAFMPIVLLIIVIFLMTVTEALPLLCPLSPVVWFIILASGCITMLVYDITRFIIKKR